MIILLTVITRTRISCEENSKRHNSASHLGRVTDFILCISSVLVVYICTKSHKNMLNGIRLMDRIRMVGR